MELVDEKFYEITDAYSFLLVMSEVTEMCAVLDEGEGWAMYDEVDISIVRSTNLDEDDENSYNVVSDNCTTFDVIELAQDSIDDDTNPKVEAIYKFVKNLPIGKAKGKYYVRASVFAESN